MALRKTVMRRHTHNGDGPQDWSPGEGPQANIHVSFTDVPHSETHSRHLTRHVRAAHKRIPAVTQERIALLHSHRKTIMGGGKVEKM